MSKIIKGRTPLLALILFVFAVGYTFAADKVVVIPMAGNDVAITSEVRTPISSVPFTISKLGSYYFTGNLAHTDTASNAITVNADHVTLDMMGFVLTGPGKESNGQAGVYMNGRTNVIISNGTVREFGGSGVYEQNSSGRGHRLVQVSVVNNKIDGIRLEGRSHQLRDCTALGNGQTGLYSAGLITNNTAADNGLDGIYSNTGSTVINNTVRLNSRWGIRVTGNSNLIEGNTVLENNVGNTANKGGIMVHFRNRVVGNTLWNNKQNGIFVDGNGNIIESNHVTASTIGINFTLSGNAYRDNTASGNTTAYGGNDIGNTVDGGGNLNL